jgi:hypothetical protein
LHQQIVINYLNIIDIISSTKSLFFLYYLSSLVHFLPSPSPLFTIHCSPSPAKKECLFGIPEEIYLWEFFICSALAAASAAKAATEAAAAAQEQQGKDAPEAAAAAAAAALIAAAARAVTASACIVTAAAAQQQYDPQHRVVS